MRNAPRRKSTRATSHDHQPLPLESWSGDGHTSTPSFSVAAPPPWSGDGHGRAGSADAPWLDPRHKQAQRFSRSDGYGDSVRTLSPELQLVVNPGYRQAPTHSYAAALPQRPARPARPEKSDNWKLMFLVVVFLVWISTASTLLFLYMDQYLFP